MSREAFIYIIGSTVNPVKIGRAANVKQRLCDLQIGNPDPLVVHYTFKVPAGLIEDVEDHLHRVLRHHWRRGEWFNIKADAA